MQTWMKTIIQIIFFVAISKLADFTVERFHLPMPPSVFGILLVFALLQSKIIPLKWMELGSSWLLAQMLLFFIPAAVGIIKYKSLIITSGLPITITIIASTIAVMMCSGLMGQWVSKLLRRSSE
ncbi:CidA/LrgA family holin-like protein [Paenibacillus sp. HWE-109]|uniref:CidA/LrgA family protein n=1 Tax=Paenibacillus sp. HWE-109 TaxID=1306526 RepID=UPI001EDEE4EE|nr:CidA/LrgA family holin-like protein [Paenibacillus sp. HWE-109]UKS29285.1 CidA/LrgA family holin-like protein [Paenibacillus sp. HWE-109]